MDKEEKKQKKDDKKIIETALKRYKICEDAMRDNIKLAKDDLQFVYGDGVAKQWDDDVLTSRKGRPSLVINKLPVFINRVANDQRQNRPAIKIRGFDSKRDPTTAKCLQGLIRHIQNNADSDTAIDTACISAIRCGLGYFRILTRYVSDTTRNQEIYIERIKNALSVLFPIHLCQRIDWSDAPYAFILHPMPKDEYEETYDDDVDEWPDNENTKDWKNTADDTVRLAEYFVMNKSKRDIFFDEEGKITEEKTEDTRKVQTQEVTWYLISANKVLETRKVPGKWIPVIPVVGDEVNIEGKDYYISLPRNAKDAQRHYNYFKSAEAEKIALAPIAPWVGAEGQFEGHEDEWDEAHKVPTGRLEYKPTTLGGQLVPPPQRTPPTNIDGAIMTALQGSSDDIKATIGMFDASLGAPSNEKSGRAIIARQRQGDTGTFHFGDNTIKALKHAGRIVVDMIPEVYDNERIIRILGEDMADEVMEINSATGGKLSELETSELDIVIDVGPSFTTRRVEAAETLISLAQAVPVIGQVAPDIIARNLDFAEAKELAARLKATVPPEIIAASDQDAKGFQPQQGMNPQEIQQIIADLMKVQGELNLTKQQNAQFQQIIGKMQQELENKDKDRQLEMAKAQLSAQTTLEKTSIQVKPEMLQALMESVAFIRGRIEQPGQPQNAQAATPVVV